MHDDNQRDTEEPSRHYLWKRLSLCSWEKSISGLGPLDSWLPGWSWGVQCSAYLIWPRSEVSKYDPYIGFLPLPSHFICCHDGSSDCRYHPFLLLTLNLPERWLEMSHDAHDIWKLINCWSLRTIACSSACNLGVPQWSSFWIRSRFACDRGPPSMRRWAPYSRSMVCSASE